MLKRVSAVFIILATMSCAALQERGPMIGTSAARRMAPQGDPHQPMATQRTLEVLDESPKPQGGISRSIGVLLPLSGPYKIYGERSLAAMRLAFGPGTSESSNGALILRNPEGFSLVAIDTKGQVERAKQGVDRLVDEFQVASIIGDILADTALAISRRANERKVLNLSLSRRDALTSVGPHIFRMAMTARKQVSALVSMGSPKQELKRFAVLYPENAFGIEMRDAFIAEVKKRDGIVAKVEGYKADETTFTTHVRHLVGARKTTGNAAYLLCMERSARMLDNIARKKVEGDCLDAVAPTINFDALFIPEFPKTLAYIVPALISEGVMVSQNESMLRSYRRTSHISDAVPVQLLGPSSWNNALVGEKLGNQIDGALFVDSAHLSEPREEVRRFVEAFKRQLTSGPALAEAFAYDSIGVIREIYGPTDEQENLTLEQISTRLQKVQYDGVSGKISFDQDRESVIPFRWFAFREGKILPQS